MRLLYYDKYANSWVAYSVDAQLDQLIKCLDLQEAVGRNDHRHHTSINPSVWTRSESFLSRLLEVLSFQTNDTNNTLEKETTILKNMLNGLLLTKVDEQKIHLFTATK